MKKYIITFFILLFLTLSFVTGVNYYVLSFSNDNYFYDKNNFGLKTIGYKEIVDYLEGKISLEEAISLVQKHNRNYAKRQLTWFRKYEENL